VGARAGENYSVNVPLQEGITDESYFTVFKPVIEKVMEMYRPTGEPTPPLKRLMNLTHLCIRLCLQRWFFSAAQTRSLEID
jgi:hypothetical protein